MSQDEVLRRLELEQRAFEARLDQMLASHEGEFVVFRDSEPIGFYGSFQDAFRSAIDRFGVREVFLVSEIRKRPVAPPSTSWQSGVTFTIR
jgi:hypothetical protein